jgi:PLP dependent protein
MRGPGGDPGSGRASPDAAEVERLATTRATVLERIAEAASRVGRDPSTVTLVAVSKTVPAARLRAAVVAGLDLLGENRVQEAEAKVDLVPGARWHLVGPLQSNKARRAVALFHAIESVDSVDLALRLDRLVRERRERAGDRGRVPPAAGQLVRSDRAEPPADADRPAPSGRGDRLPILLQVNVDADAGKAGFAPADLGGAVAEIAGLEALELAGLMTIGRLVDDAEAARPTFAALRDLAARTRGAGLPLGPELSMGMSDDYGVAVEEGATIVRVGRALFGERR